MLDFPEWDIESPRILQIPCSGSFILIVVYSSEEMMILPTVSRGSISILLLLRNEKEVKRIRILYV